MVMPLETLAIGGEVGPEGERARLVRLCLHLTGDPCAAEDLAQETLLVALQREATLRDPEKREAWLAGIARNLCLHWRRAVGLERSRSALSGIDESTRSPADLDQLPGDADVVTALEQAEFTALLDRALALLPSEMGEALVERYVQEARHADIAARLGIRETAVKKRVERGRRALQQIFTRDLRQEALSYGLISPEAGEWEETRIWCPGCGRRRLHGRFRPADGRLTLRCPLCSPRPSAHYVDAFWGDGFADLRTLGPALSRVLTSIHAMLRECLVEGAVRCPRCRDWLPIRRGRPPSVPTDWPDLENIYLWCPRCAFSDIETWHSLTWSLPEVRCFWREHPRMRFLPPREIEAEGSPAVVTGFESLTGGARIEVVTLRDTYEVVSIDGAARMPTRAD